MVLDIFKPIAPRPQLVHLYMNRPVLQISWPCWPRLQPAAIDVTFKPGTNFFYRPFPKPDTNSVLDALRVLKKILVGSFDDVKHGWLAALFYPLRPSDRMPGHKAKGSFVVKLTLQWRDVQHTWEMHYHVKKGLIEESMTIQNPKGKAVHSWQYDGRSNVLHLEKERMTHFIRPNEPWIRRLDTPCCALFRKWAWGILDVKTLDREQFGHFSHTGSSLGRHGRGAYHTLRDFNLTNHLSNAWEHPNGFTLAYPDVELLAIDNIIYPDIFGMWYGKDPKRPDSRTGISVSLVAEAGKRNALTYALTSNDLFPEGLILQMLPMLRLPITLVLVEGFENYVNAHTCFPVIRGMNMLAAYPVIVDCKTKAWPSLPRGIELDGSFYFSTNPLQLLRPNRKYPTLEKLRTPWMTDEDYPDFDLNPCEQKDLTY